MYYEDFEEQIYQKLQTVLGGSAHIGYYAGELADKDAIMNLAKMVQVRPSLLLNVAPEVENNGSDSTNRVDRDNIAVEVIVATYDPRSLRDQRKKALEYIFGTRKALQGLNLTSDYTASAPIAFSSFREDFNVMGLCAYTVVFRVEATLDLDEI